MSAEALIEKVRSYIEQADDQEMAALEDFINTVQNDHTWDWNELPEHVKVGVEEGISQADRGETITWEEFKQANSRWFGK